MGNEKVKMKKQEIEMNEWRKKMEKEIKELKRKVERARK